MQSLYKTPAGKEAILELYDQKLEELNVPTTSINIETQYGSTHILQAGDPSKAPLILVHGSNGCAPIALETYALLLDHFNVYAVDVLAQPNKSAETRLSMKDASYGIWMNEIIDSLQLTEVSLAGFSFGGLVILKTLEHDESKIKEVFLSAPAYIVNGNPFKSLFKVFRPMKKYMKTQDKAYVENFLGEVFTHRDTFAIEFLSQIFLHFNMDFTPVPVIKKKNAQQITTPITLFAADQDIMFPGKKMLKRAEKIFPSLRKAVLLENSKHVQNSEQNRVIQEEILASSLDAL
ncbi:Pimeloyl-ACP methyl ester carboxylesterase [Lishizhenia tianjinensis]|uniref:Pimeloyl-ACP methyl ester carboxylesterase n=1 Tax=Lishizhenia tianjinensis TaxID=477690 RepID=A0A1I6XL72_9FLAO|nr:alpha/beta hydrolase [Lishizhenia tianjinensis]SFT38584.1 Pimeloyl-ACP methyl ester carboxylesterase [Lishizhenia tianjinensis]